MDVKTAEYDESRTAKTVKDKATVLVVDDDEKFLKAFGEMLKSENCEMISASNSLEALEKIKGRRVDLLITEFMLKNKSSIELFTLIRKTHPEIPIIVATANTDLITGRDVKMLGGNHLVLKPLEVLDIRKLLNDYCSRLNTLN